MWLRKFGIKWLVIVEVPNFHQAQARSRLEPHFRKARGSFGLDSQSSSSARARKNWARSTLWLLLRQRGFVIKSSDFSSCWWAKGNKVFAGVHSLEKCYDPTKLSPHNCPKKTTTRVILVQWFQLMASKVLSCQRSTFYVSRKSFSIKKGTCWKIRNFRVVRTYLDRRVWFALIAIPNPKGNEEHSSGLQI